MSPYFDFQEVLERVPSQIDALITTLIPTARKQAGCYRSGNERGERGSSFSISTSPHNAGCYFDFADPSVKGNAITLVGITKNLGYEEAGVWLAQFLGVQPKERVHLPKIRPTPKINQTERTMRVGDREMRFTGLDQRSIDYALSRGITEATLRLHKCVSAENSILFPHFDSEKKLVLMKAWSTDGNKRIFTNTDPVPVLFGKDQVNPMKTGGRLIITEGHWDSMTWTQLGFPAVSIPSGAGNDEWIAEDWNFLNLFSSIMLDFDDDEEGHKAEGRVRARLGIERCRAIKYRYKDANAALQAGAPEVLLAALHAAENAPIERIVNVSSIREKVRNRVNRTHMAGGVPFFLASMNMEFRPHEITLWFGVTSHGKSSVLNQQICYAASRGEKCMVASFEQPVDKTIADMLIQYTGDPDIGSSSDFEQALADLESQVLFYDSMVRTKPEELVATMRLAYKTLGVTQFVVDNAMTLDVDRQDNTAQANTADLFRVFASQIPAHVHEVMHIRKPKDDNAKPPSIPDIMGAMEWSAMAYNIVAVWRDTAKHERIALMYDEKIDAIQIAEFARSMPDGKVLVRKQRETGALPICSYFYEAKTKRAWKEDDDLCPYWNPPEVPLDPEPADQFPGQ